MKSEVIAYINSVEKAICGEFCGDEWPKCDSDLHKEGLRLLAKLGAEASI